MHLQDIGCLAQGRVWAPPTQGWGLERGYLDCGADRSAPLTIVSHSFDPVHQQQQQEDHSLDH